MSEQCAFCGDVIGNNGKFTLSYDGDPALSYTFCSTYCIAACLAIRLVTVMKDATIELKKLKLLLKVENE